jgi:hypothetical protein
MIILHSRIKLLFRDIEGDRLTTNGANMKEQTETKDYIIEVPIFEINFDTGKITFQLTNKHLDQFRFGSGKATIDMSKICEERLIKNVVINGNGKVTHNKNFETFWKAYPTRDNKRIGKKECSDWWNKKVTDEKLGNIIINATKNFALSEKATTNFAEDPIRFLKHERYNDYLQNQIAEQEKRKPKWQE